MRPLRVSVMTAVVICLSGLCETAHAADEEGMERLLDAIAHVESRTDANAVGDHGRAVGVYQIHRRYWQDGTRILGVNWEYADALDPVKARQVVRAYLSHYGRNKSLVDMARIHNGGPRGDRMKATQRYAAKIMAIMNEDRTS